MQQAYQRLSRHTIIGPELDVASPNEELVRVRRHTVRKFQPYHVSPREQTAERARMRIVISRRGLASVDPLGNIPRQAAKDLAQLLDDRHEVRVTAEGPGTRPRIGRLAATRHSVG